MKRFLVGFLLVTQALLAHFPGQNICSSTRCYTLIEELGSGAFGVVYSAEDQDYNNFAIKVYRGYDFGGLGDMEREFKNGQRFDHPRILKSHELFNSEEENFLSLDLIKGASLGRTTQQLDPVQTLEEMIQFCNAISYSLQKGYLHIDLHNGNIMLNEEGEIIIIDLASFFSFEELTASPANYSHFQQGARQKLQEFFQQHPTLKQDLDDICRELEKNPTLWMILKLLNPLASENIWKYLFAQNFMGKDYRCHLSFYFSNVVNISIEILDKSTMDEEQKNVLISEMQALSNECAIQEEIQDGSKIGLYLEKLEALLQDHLAKGYYTQTRVR